MNIATLKNKLLLVWNAETALGSWTSECPSLNQCAVTALIVQDYFGGELLRCKMTNNDSHYWNRLPDGTEEDLTAEQFNYIDDKPIKEEYIVRDREYVLSFPSTVVRYELLKKRLEEITTP